VARVRGVWIERRQDIGEGGDQVQPDDDGGAEHRQLVLAEAPPHQLPLAGNRDLLLDVGDRRRCADRRRRRHQALAAHRIPNRIRGSSQASKRSEKSVPTTVRTLSIRMKLPARYMSWDCSARRSSGPVVGRLSTTATIASPETISGKVQPTVET